MNKSSRRLTIEEAYGILGIPKDASLEKIVEAYRKYVKQNHPDVSDGAKVEELKLVNAIYPKILEAARRTEAGGSSGGTMAGSGGRPVYDQDMEEPDRRAGDKGDGSAGRQANPSGQGTSQPHGGDAKSEAGRFHKWYDQDMEEPDRRAGDKGDDSAGRQANPSGQGTSQPHGGDAKSTYAHPNGNTATATGPEENFADLVRKGDQHSNTSPDYAIACYSRAAEVADERGFRKAANSARRKIIVLSLERARLQSRVLPDASWESYLMAIRTAEKYEPAAGSEDSLLKSSVVSACLKSADIAESPRKKVSFYLKAVEFAERYGLASTASNIKNTALSFCMAVGDKKAGKDAMGWYGYGKELSERYGNSNMAEEFGRMIRSMKEAEENPFMYIPRGW